MQGRPERKELNKYSSTDPVACVPTTTISEIRAYCQGQYSSARTPVGYITAMKQFLKPLAGSMFKPMVKKVPVPAYSTCG